MKRRLTFVESIKQGLREGLLHNLGEIQLRVIRVRVPDPPVCGSEMCFGFEEIAHDGSCKHASPLDSTGPPLH